jgi:hypothetical protein
MLHRSRVEQSPVFDELAVPHAVARAACRDGWDLAAAKIEAGPERDVG